MRLNVLNTSKRQRAQTLCKHGQKTLLKIQKILLFPNQSIHARHRVLKYVFAFVLSRRKRLPVTGVRQLLFCIKMLIYYLHICLFINLFDWRRVPRVNATNAFLTTQILTTIVYIHGFD